MAKRNTSNSSFQAGAKPPVPLDVRLTRMAANALLVLAAGALLAMAVLAVSRSPWFNIRAISLEGDLQHNTVPLVRAIVLPHLNGNYFSLNLREARRAFESVPWVRRATVRRVWPNKLVVTLEQHRAAAYWERDDGNHQMVNLQGEVFDVNLGDVEEDGLPLLRGPEGMSAQVWQMYRQLAPVFTPLGEKIRHLKLSMRGSWQTTLESGARIELGRGTPDEVLERTQRFAATVAQVTSRYARDGQQSGQREGHGIEYADLRHDDAYALRLRGVSTLHDTDTRTPAPSARPARR